MAMAEELARLREEARMLQRYITDLHNGVQARMYKIGREVDRCTGKPAHYETWLAYRLGETDAYIVKKGERMYPTYGISGSQGWRIEGLPEREIFTGYMDKDEIKAVLAIQKLHRLEALRIQQKIEREEIKRQKKEGKKVEVVR